MATVAVTVSVPPSGDGCAGMMYAKAVLHARASLYAGHIFDWGERPAVSGWVQRCALAGAVLLGLLALPASAETLTSVLISNQDGRISVETRFTCSFFISSAGRYFGFLDPSLRFFICPLVCNNSISL